MSLVTREIDRGVRMKRNGGPRNRDWGRFPLILNKERKVVLFPPGFQTV